MTRCSRVSGFLPAAALLLLLSFTVQSAKMEASLLWKYDLRVSNQNLFVVDLTGDGTREIVADAPQSGIVYAINSNGEQAWRYSVGAYFYDFYATEPDSNGVFLVAGMFRNANGVDSTGKVVWRRPMGYSDARSVFASDLNNDGRLDFVIGSFSGTRTSMEVVDSNGQLIEEVALKGRQIPYVTAAADINGDNMKEILTGGAIFSINTIAENYELIPGKGNFYVFDNKGKLLWSADEGVYSVDAGDLDGDGFLEVLLGTSAQVVAYNYKGEKQWSFNTGGTVKSLLVGDVNNDSVNEVVAGAGKKVFLIDGKGDKKWDYSADTPVVSIDVEDIDGNGNLEVIIGSTTVEVVSDKGVKMWESEALRTLTKVVAEDINGDTFVELVAGSSDGFVRVYETAKYAKGQRAVSYKSLAEARYDQMDYTNAKYYAENALALYEDLNDVRGVKDMKDFLSKVDARIEADGYYNISMTLFRKGDYAEASEYAVKANQVYRNIGTSFGYIEQLNAVIDTYRNISDSWNQYNMSVELYQSGSYSEASSHALNARNLYLILNNTDMVLKCEQVYNNSVDHIAADGFFAEAQVLQETGNVSASLEYYSRADEIYLRLGDVNGTQNVKENVDKINSALWRKDLRKYGWVAIGIGFLLAVFLVVVIASWLIAKTKGGEFKLLFGAESKKPEPIGGELFKSKAGSSLGKK
ncbi:MAG: hypothetical protein FJY77_04995 [Candidatus Altiarchaeales archaeon]|nr:hypothetical protein [Candidatus Altiarchaeales archaeon]